MSPPTRLCIHYINNEVDQQWYALAINEETIRAAFAMFVKGGGPPERAITDGLLREYRELCKPVDFPRNKDVIVSRFLRCIYALQLTYKRELLDQDVVALRLLLVPDGEDG